MKNNFKTIIVCVLCVAVFLMATGCGKQETVENPQETTQGSQDILQDIIDDVIKENEKQEMGTYVTPAESCFVWETVEGGVMITGYTGTDKSIIVPDTLGGENVVAIGSGAFNQAEIVGVKLPGMLTTVGEKAFYFCATLREVYMGEETLKVADQAFEGCVALENVVLNNGLEEIGRQAFGLCSMLTSIEFPTTLKIIGVGSFCLSGLESVVIPSSVEVIDESAFETCSALKTAKLESGVKSVGRKAFAACGNLVNVEIPNTVESFGTRVFAQSENVIIKAPAGSAAEIYAEDNELTFEAS